MKRDILLALVLVFCTGSLRAERNLPTAQDYLGRWNVKILKTNDTFYSAWLKVEGVGGNLSGNLVWKWGGVTKIRDVAVVDGELRFSRGREKYSARLKGNEIQGTAVMGRGRKFNFLGRRAPEMCDISGTWKVVLADNPDARPGILTFQERGGKITGKAVDGDGNLYSFQDLELDTSDPMKQGYVLSFRGVPKNKQLPGAEARLNIRGDVMEGAVTMSPPGAEKVTLQVRGKRERAWGEPVSLLKENGLDGWVTRGQPGRKFNWKVENGILRNSPPDDDIKSLKKFRDLRLHMEYKVEKGANSGIYLRGYYELQILGSGRIQPHGNMAVYSRLSPKANPIKEPLEESWQTIEVTFIGRWLTVVLNGKTIYDNQYLEGITGGAVEPWEGEPGPLLLQGDHGNIQFRNIVVTPAK